ncbi:pyruvate/2-oxoglutarate dehydrogenase complex, dihydrolipoamide acyltransferase component [Caldisphaera lagunensis DSM 15908]|uniref:Pyruvate/2-oxoglutarate dehydrogenase complex, dihydrolipoamide acyltransferase component n=1 Tax=Caldisphaera lagunensis (strain DSM 15908 / JCM 11604 / ANMR 0165 / IC-154) TaxID=1056495 RepID=L0A9J2_CALLD|nr:lipoyl domain-containing protein [Caldisphaera lagunensis]AFZ70084.1 pyruvate/2-oxoglutarate dehydrogenase complex, dihydrolipoamide acyltransferase component [Caldisphaera lagunensis DSM 15908]
MIIQVPNSWDFNKFGYGIVADWYKKEGESVKEGEIICLIMVSKVRVEVKSNQSGKLVKIIANKGTKVKPGDALAEIE